MLCPVDEGTTIFVMRPLRSRPKWIERPTGTIHLGARNASGDLGGCTTTSGLAFKIPGRVGDSPLIGCGNYVDNDHGVAGSTGRGEAAESGPAWRGMPVRRVCR